MASIKKPPAVMSDKVRRELSNPERHSTCAISAAIKPPPAAAGLTPAMACPVSSLSAVLPSEDDSKEISLGTVASLQVYAASTPRLADRLDAKQAETYCPPAAEHGQESKASVGNPIESCIKGESAAAVPPDALEGVPLSDQEREDITAGLTPAQARRAAEARVDTLEWMLGLETLTQEQAERVACFRRMDAALISARGNKPYLDTRGIPMFPSDCEPKYRHWEHRTGQLICG